MKYAHENSKKFVFLQKKEVMHVLGVVGPFQLGLIVLILLGILIAIPIILISSRAKHKARANTLDQVLQQQRNQSPQPQAQPQTETKSTDDTLAQLERLTKLKESGALSEAEFEIEKKKILG